MTSPITQALEALSAASDCIGIDRTALAESHFDHQLGRVDDEGQEGLDAYDEVLAKIDDAIGDLRAADAGVPPPIDMVLHCPKCGKQHIDAPEPPCNKGCCGVLIPHIHPGAWSNPPHRSHLCHGCGHIWRPADVPTNGVEAVKTKGSADSAISASPAAPAPQPLHPNHLPDLRYALDALRLASEAIEPLTEAQIKLHRIKRDTAERIDAAIVGMRYIIKRTEEAAESAATPAPAPAMEGQQAAERCLDCGDPVPKRVCYCQAGCAHVGSPAVAPSAQPVTREFTNELGNSIRITIEGPTSISENVLTPVEFAELRAAIGAAPSAQEPDPNAAQLVKEQSPINKAFWDGVRWAQQPQAAGVSEPEAAKLARRADRLVQVLTAGRAVPTESVIEALREMRDAIGYGICSYYCPACFAAVRSLSTTSAPAQAEPSEPRLPYDVKVGATTFRKGVALSTFVMAAQRWHREAFPDYYTLTDEQKAANFARLQGAAHGEAAQQAGGAA